jgi:DNA-binding PucR family transcriptional regulator
MAVYPLEFAQPSAASARGYLSDLRALLALSMLMAEAADEDDIVELAADAVSTLTACCVEGIYIGDGQWRRTMTPCNGLALQAYLQDHMTTLGRMGGAVDVPVRPWAWAYPMYRISGSAGFVVVSAAAQPHEHDQFQLRLLAQQTGLALTTLRLRLRERRAAAEQATLNARLEETVTALRRGMKIHERLTEAAASGVGVEGITRVVHELTGLPVIVEDRAGHQQAMAGLGAEAEPSVPFGQRRERLLDNALERRRSVWHDGRWLALARTREEILGILVLLDPDRSAGAPELMALEYGATVLAIELAHMQSLAEVELRLRRDIVEDLLSGTDERSVVLRARGLRYDLARPHRVVVVDASGQIDGERLFRSVRLAARNSNAGSLVVARADSVVLLAHTDVEWEKLHAAIGRELGESACRLGVGGRCERPRDFPRSYHEARFALGLQALAGHHTRSLCFDDLGVLRLLGQVADPANLRELVTSWLDTLLRHDARRGSEYVETLAVYLECGGNHEQAAKTLIVHRSTLKYRLRRIHEISGYDLADHDIRFHLELAARAWRTLQTLGQPVTASPAESEAVGQATGAHR